MILFILFVQYNIVNCIHQLNPLQERPYFQSLNTLFDFDGLDVKISGPTLGFSIQGGIVEGSEKKLNIQNSTIISTSFAELNTLAILSFDEEYRVDLLQINYDRQLENFHENLFKISNHKCQYIKNLHFYRVIVHCLAENNEVIIFFHQTEVSQYKTSHIMNDADNLKSVNIQIKQEWEFFHDLVIYVSYMFTDHSEVYEMSFGESVSFQLLWNESYEHNQISVANQQIYALHPDYVDTRHIIQLWAYVVTEYHYLTMNTEYVEQFKIVYAVTTDSIIIFNERLKLIRKIDLPFYIEQAQLYGKNQYLYLLTENSTLIYKIQKDGHLLLYQYSNQVMINALGLYGSISDIFVAFDKDILHTYQLFNYSLYNPSPQESGILNLSFYSINGTLVYSKEIYINILSNYKDELVPRYYQEDKLLTQLNNQQQFQIKLKDYFEGPNLEDYVRSQFDQHNIQDIGPPQLKFDDAQILLAYPLDSLSGYLTLNLTNKVFQTKFFNYSTNGESDWEFQVTIDDDIQKILVINTKSQEILALLMNDQLIQVYQIKPLKEVTHCYKMSISYFTSKLNINKTVAFENQLLIHNGQGFEYFMLFADIHYYSGSRGQYDFVSVKRQGSIDILFQTEYYKIDIVNYGLFKWSYEQRIYFDYPEQVHTLYPIPLDQCMILMSTNIYDTQLYYYDNIYKIKDIGHKYDQYIYMIGPLFQPSQLAYSNKHFYIWVQSEETQDNYIYVFGCSDNQINQPKKVIPISGPVQRINAYSSFEIEADIITYQVDNATYIYQMAFEQILLISPNPQQGDVEDVKDIEDVNNVEDVSNENSEIEIQSEPQKQNLTVTINDDNTNVVGQLINQNNDHQEGTLIVNPYDLFDGTIYYFSIQCEKCDNFNYTPIIQVYGNYTQNTEGSLINQSNNNQLYIQSTHEIFKQDIAALPQKKPQEIELESIYKIWENGNNKILLTFIEINSQTLSWIYQDGQSIYIYSMFNNNQTASKFIANASNIFMVIYQEGFLQLGLDNTYNCYYYIIENDIQVLKIVAQDIKVDETDYNDPPFLILVKNQDYIIFGSLLINKAQRVYGMVLNVTLNDYQLKSYDIFNFEEPLFDKTLSPLQSLTLLEIEIPKFETDTYINIAYTTLQDAGRIRLLFYKMKFIHYKIVCNFIIPQPFENSNNRIRIAANEFQIALLKEVEIINEKIFFINMYLVDDSQCSKSNVVEPYAFLLIYNPVSLFEQRQSIKFVSQNHLLFSYGQGSIIFYIQKYLIINYSTSGDAEINIKAHKVLDSQLLYNRPKKAMNQSISDQFYILLFILISVFTLLSIIFLVLYRKIKLQKTQGQVQTSNQSIEVPSE